MTTPRMQWLLDLVETELTTAMNRFEPFNSPHEGKAVIEEELDELWEHVKDNGGRGAFAVDEAIQVAAMALLYVHDLAVTGPAPLSRGCPVGPPGARGPTGDETTVEDELGPESISEVIARMWETHGETLKNLAGKVWD